MKVTLTVTISPRHQRSCGVIAMWRDVASRGVVEVTS